MSVWVEMIEIRSHVILATVTLHVSVWVEIEQFVTKATCLWVTLHVSVWVEIVIKQAVYMQMSRHAPRERVSWNTEPAVHSFLHLSHAPRERVSWNLIIMKYLRILFASRSTWACELKCCQNIQVQVLNHVTLHVSVWVEMPVIEMRRRFPVVTLHVSVWVEMTICFKRPAPSACHAPRERVSWNGSEWLRRCWTACHAPRERVSWNSMSAEIMW